MFERFRRNKDTSAKPETYPEPEQGLAQGVYNRWKSSYLAKSSSHSAMYDTIEYFIITAIGKNKTHVVRVMQDLKDSSRYNAQYAEDSRIFHRPVSEVLASDIMNAYYLSYNVKEFSSSQDHFGLRRVGTLEDFLEAMKKGE